MPEIPFQHVHAAHCESGVTSSLLRHGGAPVTEPLALGIGSGLFFLHLPFKSLGGGPTTSFRSSPGGIFRRTCKRLGVNYQVRRYSDPDKGMADLDALIAKGVPAGIQTNVYWLSFMPARFRFQFNAHNLIVYGRRNGSWMISDPVLDAPVECPDDSLRRARFAKGFMAPRGKLYHLTDVPKLGEAQITKAMRAGSLQTAWAMSQIPLPFVGAKGIQFLANRVERWPTRFPDPRDSLLQLANIVRMLEEIGTGGAGFRYVYAAFLQEASERLSDPPYKDFSKRLTEIGDTWRLFSAKVARVCRSRKAEVSEFKDVATMLRDLGAREQVLFGDIYRHEKSRPKA